MNRPLLLSLLLALAGPVSAADGKVPLLAPGFDSVTLPGIDTAKALAEDADADAKGNPGGWRYALPYEATISPATHGKWQALRNGRMRWTYEVKAPDARHLNFGFTRYWLPEGAELRIESADGTRKMRPFTSADNESHRQLWTPPLDTAHALVIVEAPVDAYRIVELELTRINQGYRGFQFPGKTCKSGSCNTDVACLGNGDPWNRERRAVGVISQGGSRFCTGSLVNNTANNRRMLFATASHCQITAANAPTVAVIWNFESATCRRPGSAASGSNGGGSLSQFSVGARLVAATPSITSPGSVPLTNRSDWTLLELDDPAVPAHNNYWAGWDRRSAAPTCSAPASADSTNGLCASIHHPNGDEKRITFSEQNMFEADYRDDGGGAANDVHWQVQWDSTPPILPNITGTGALPPSVTEPGSSGCPLYNPLHRQVGVLSGGASSCGVPVGSLNDQYGKLAHAWDGLGTSTTRMRDHLDPTGSNVEVLDGLDTGPSCPQITATLNAPASPSVDAPVDLTLAISGGTGPYRVAWDVDDDGIIDRTTTGVTANTSLSPRYVRATSTTIKATVTDAANCVVEAARAINVSAPDIVVTASPAVEACGDGDAALEPGERWNIPVTITNAGGNDVDNGAFVFTPLSSGSGVDLSGTADAFGYTRADNTSSVCRFQAIDVSAQPTLPLVPSSTAVAGEDDGAAVGLTLGPAPFNLYGRNVTSVIMSTNGYLATAQDDGGGEFQNICGIYPTGPDNAMLQAMHDDLVIQPGGGLRRAYFPTCPRAADAGSPTQGCTVFEWRNMGRYVGGGNQPVGNATVQAILYDQSYQIVYQYITALGDNGSSSTIAIQDFNQATRNEYACNTAAATANRSVCFFHPSAQPGATIGSPNIVINGRPFVRANNLVSGAQVQATIPVQIPTTAVCGSTISVGYAGMVDDTAFSARESTILNTTVGGGGSCNVSSCGTTFTPRTLPNSGLYQNLNRLGSGTAAFNIPRDTGTQFASVWYTAKADRSPYWYTMGGNWNTLRTQVPAVLTETRQTSTSPFGVTRSTVGSALVTFLDDTNEYAFLWNLNGTRIGEKQLRFVEELGFTGDANRSGGWFPPSEDGWGATVTDFRAPNGDSIRGVLAFIFDSDGEPRWMTASTTNITGVPLPASLAYTHCPVCPNFADFGSTSTSTGTIRMNFSGDTSASFTSLLTFPADIGGTWNSSVPMVLITPPYRP